MRGDTQKSKVCRHCFVAYHPQNIERHEYKCLSNPDAMDRLIDVFVQILQESFTPWIAHDKYYRATVFSDAPSVDIIREQAGDGSWTDAINAFLVNGRREKQGRNKALKFLDSFETYGDMVAAGMDDDSLFREMKAERDTLGMGNVESEGGRLQPIGIGKMSD